ncbi:HK97-gp10 family putative phage morphogenesis protein [Acidovorax sp. NPDC077693]|uniref:HK97-gp10 family putative phage morphogenesis protein n=1 Tax=unclassified Acidovorax TaxID=2684926 RepID=UPI0037CC525B
MAGETHIAGLDELYKVLQELPAKVEGNVMRGALRAGMKVQMDAVKALVPVMSGELQKSIRISFRSRSQKFGWVRMHLVAGNSKAWYAHLVEYGTAGQYTGSGNTVGGPYEIRPKGAKSLFFAGLSRTLITHPGAKAQPFMRPGFDAGHVAALMAVRDYVATRLPKEVAKQGR